MELRVVDNEYLTVDHLSTKELIRIFSKITVLPELHFKNVPCWIWCGNRTRDCGYGHVKYGSNDKTEKVHRLLFAWLIQPLPRGRTKGEIDHLCKRTGCCNPIHLEFVDSKTNVYRSENPMARNARKTHCVHGHPFSGDNLFYNQGKRQCRTCQRAHAEKRKANHKEDLREAARRWRSRNKERLHQYYLDNKDKLNAQNRANYIARRDRLRAERLSPDALNSDL